MHSGPGGYQKGKQVVKTANNSCQTAVKKLKTLVWKLIRKFNYNLFSLLNFQNPTSGSKVMIAVNQLLKQLIIAVKQLLKYLKL